MEHTPSDRGANSKFIFNPTNKVIGIIDEAGDAKAALRDLRGAGFTAEEVELLTDEKGAQRIDLTGEEREVFAQHSNHRITTTPPECQADRAGVEGWSLRHRSWGEGNGSA